LVVSANGVRCPDSAAAPFPDRTFQNATFTVALWAAAGVAEVAVSATFRDRAT
jgi:hypothetical protein